VVTELHRVTFWLVNESAKRASNPSVLSAATYRHGCQQPCSAPERITHACIHVGARDTELHSARIHGGASDTELHSARIHGGARDTELHSLNKQRYDKELSQRHKQACVKKQNQF
jgi:hypothetical protein